jgi:hypothetical protein
MSSAEPEYRAIVTEADQELSRRLIQSAKVHEAAKNWDKAFEGACNGVSVIRDRSPRVCLEI